MPSALYLSLLAVVLGAAASPLSTNPHDVPRERSQFAVAPLLMADHPHGTVNNSYIVMLKPHTTPVLLQNHVNFVQKSHDENPLVADDELTTGLRHVWDSHIKGYAGTFSENVVEQIRQMPEVDYVEMDQIVRTLDIDTSGQPDVQLGAPWVSATASLRP